MHGERIKIINARQARTYNNYKNTKLKLLYSYNFSQELNIVLPEDGSM
jgi:hypothetical protein